MTARPDLLRDPDADARILRLRRSRAASIAGRALHLQRPDHAREAGRKGGLARMAGVQDRKALGRWLALRRWHGVYAGPPPTNTATDKEESPHRGNGRGDGATTGGRSDGNPNPSP